MGTSGQDAAKRPFHVGILPLPDFTLIAFAAFIDTLRLAADEGDASRPINCRWTIVAPTSRPIRASCGAELTPWETLGDPARFDYIAVVGGRGDPLPAADAVVSAWLRAAAAASVTLIGLCTGTFALVGAGVMHGRKTCIGAYHAQDFADAFPHLTPVIDQWFVADRDRITCPGGVAAADVAAYLVKKHYGNDWAQKALRFQMIPRPTPANHPQPVSTTQRRLRSDRLQRAVALIEHRLSEPPGIAEIAEHAHLSPRQLQRLFKEQFGCGPHEYSRDARLRYGLWLLQTTERTVTDTAEACGFQSVSHFCRQFRICFGQSPSQARSADAAPFPDRRPSARGWRPDAHRA